MIIGYPPKKLTELGSEQLGQVVVLLGTALAGPILEPVYISGPAQATSVFGTAGTLLNGYLDAYRVNPLALYYLVRLNGAHASAVLYAPEDDSSGQLIDVVHLRSTDGGEAYNQITITVGDAVLAISEGGETRTYSFQDYPTLFRLVEQINRHASLGYSRVVASTVYPEMPSIRLVPVSTQLGGGQDNLMPTKNDLYLLLEQAYDILEGWRTDVVVPLGVYFDDVIDPYFYGQLPAWYGESNYTAPDDYLTYTHPQTGERCTFHGQLARFCARQTHFGLMAHGVLGLRPLPPPELVAALDFSFPVELVRYSCLHSRHGFSFKEAGTIYDRGHYLSLVCADLVSEGRRRSAAPAYAGLIAAAGLESTTNTSVSGFSEQYVEFTGEDMRHLARWGLVTFRRSLKRGLVVTSGVTAGLGGPLHYLPNVRSVQYVVARLKHALDPYLGLTRNPVSAQDVVQQTVEQALRAMVGEGVLRWYDFSVLVDSVPRSGTSLSGKVELRLRPRYAVEDIGTSFELMIP